ncbi:hypothetical protein QLG07_12380 [Erwinia sp. V90_4]|uniref:hypothetical protein n=1 Tax=Erwinia sp. V90_4 TaxID=3044239 RepID=UPI00249DBF5D|nr:hypothetical protein [Erwinia sp. V90_4]MDI3440258.1 hypothetical protein [Erwinia sp. V90_4]
MRYVMTACLAAILLTLYLPRASAADPCKVTLCLWGKMNGSLRTGCTEAEQSFFNIVKKKHGSFLPGPTFDARKDALNNECPAPYGASQFVGKVLGKYGSQRKA